MLLNDKLDIVLITESWLNDTVSDPMIAPTDKFYTVRRDRINRQGGGVCAIVNRKFTIDVLDTDPNLELIAFDIIFAAFTYRCILCYRPPFYDNNASNYFNLLLESLKTLCNTKHVFMLFGDFNLPYICWDRLLATGPHANHNMFLEFTSEHGLIQCVAEPTRDNNILDLILVNDPLVINSCVTATPLGNSDHNIVEFNLVIPTDKPSNLYKPPVNDDVKQYCYNFKEADFDGLNDFLSAIDWQSVLCSDNSNNCIESFINILNIGMEEFVPLKPVTNLSCPSHDRKYIRHYPLSIRCIIFVNSLVKSELLGGFTNNTKLKT